MSHAHGRRQADESELGENQRDRRKLSEEKRWSPFGEELGEMRNNRRDHDERIERVLGVMMNKRAQAPESTLSMWFKCLSTKADYDVVADTKEQKRFTIRKKDELLARAEGLEALLQEEARLKLRDEDKASAASRTVVQLRKDLVAANVEVSRILPEEKHY